MASAPSASWNSRCITHLANCPNRSLPTNSSDESEKRARHWLQRVSHRERHEAYNLSSHLFADRTTEVEFRREGVWAGCCPWHDLRKAALYSRRGRDNHRASSYPYLWRMGQEPRRSDVPESGNQCSMIHLGILEHRIVVALFAPT